MHLETPNETVHQRCSKEETSLAENLHLKVINQKRDLFAEIFNLAEYSANIYLFKLAVETPEKCVKYVLRKVNNKDTRTKSVTSFWCPYC